MQEAQSHPYAEIFLAFLEIKALDAPASEKMLFFPETFATGNSIAKYQMTFILPYTENIIFTLRKWYVTQVPVVKLEA